MTIAVRAASVDDQDIVVELIQELAQAIGETSPVKREHVRRWLADPACGTLLGELDGQVVGLLTYQIKSSLYHAGRSSMVEELVVREEARSRGVGGALLDEAMRRAQASGCAEAGISTLPDNTAAARLYRRHGFTHEELLLELTSSADVPQRRARAARMNHDGERRGAPPRALVRDAHTGDETAVVRLVTEMGAGLRFPTSIDEPLVRRYLTQPAATILGSFSKASRRSACSPSPLASTCSMPLQSVRSKI